MSVLREVFRHDLRSEAAHVIAWNGENTQGNTPVGFNRF